jgi:hypothetical protein
MSRTGDNCCKVIGPWFGNGRRCIPTSSTSSPNATRVVAESRRAVVLLVQSLRQYQTREWVTKGGLPGFGLADLA